MFTIRIKILTAFPFTTENIYLLMVLLKRKRARDLYSEAYVMTALYKDVYSDEWKKAICYGFFSKGSKNWWHGAKNMSFH